MSVHTKPRLTLSISEEDLSVLRQVSELSGQPMSGVVSNLITLSLPMLQNQIKTFQRVRSEQDAHKKKISEVFESSTLNGVFNSKKKGRK